MNKLNKNSLPDPINKGFAALDAAFAAEKQKRIDEVRGTRVKMKTNRNGFCPCGSGERYKNCCFTADIQSEKLDKDLRPIQPLQNENE